MDVGRPYADVVRTWIYVSRLLEWYGELNRVRTAQNLKVFRIIAEDDIILVAGAVPGTEGGTVFLRGAVKKKNAGKPKG